MKTRILLAVLTAALGFSSHAMTGSRLRAIKSQLSSTAIAELPHIASRLTKEAASSEQAAVARIVLDWIAQNRPAAFPQSAATIAKISRSAVAAAISGGSDTAGAPIAKPLENAKETPLPRSLRAADYLSSRAAASVSVIVPKPVAPSRVFGPPIIVTVQQSSDPINTSTGGAGDGTFNGASAEPAGTPFDDGFDYHSPRS